MTLHDDCLRNHVPPGLGRGEERRDGKYLRCLDRHAATRRYADDADGTFGYRLRPEKWGWRYKDIEGGLSVSLSECARAPGCAIAFHPNPELFCHVVELDLPALAAELEIELTAVYDPVPAPGDPPTRANPCHFNILPVDVSIDDLIAKLKILMADVFPPGPKSPKQEPERTQALAARARFEAVFRLFRDAATN